MSSVENAGFSFANTFLMDAVFYFLIQADNLTFTHVKKRKGVGKVGRYETDTTVYLFALYQQTCG